MALSLTQDHLNGLCANKIGANQHKFFLFPSQRPITAICWGHRDSRLFLSSGPALYVVRVEHRIANLQLLCQQAIVVALRDEKDFSKLTLPPRLCSYLTAAFVSTIKVYTVINRKHHAAEPFIVSAKYIEMLNMSHQICYFHIHNGTDVR